MTGPASTSRGRVFPDFDSYKTQEWLRRRKLRLEQVRRQSNDIAKAIREKVVSEEKTRTQELEQIEEAKFMLWKSEKLDDLERKLRFALEKFGEGYKLASAEPDVNKVIHERNTVNLEKAKERGEMAQKEEIRRKKLAEEEKMAFIERKKMARKLEDLRSALVRSVPVQKQSLLVRKNHDEFCKQEVRDIGEKRVTVMKKKVLKPKKDQESVQRKVTVKKSNKKSSVSDRDQLSEIGKSCCCRKKVNVSEVCPPKETVWINLNEIKSSSTNEISLKSRSSASGTICAKHSKEISEEGGRGGVEFYDYSSRYHCKTYKEFPHLVERIDQGSQPSAMELSKIEEESETLEAKKKHEVDLVNLERGAEALRIEKINRDYNNLITKLDELNKKEKIIKVQHRIPPTLVHMTEDRLAERIKTKQRIMESKFESIYYEATTVLPHVERQPHVLANEVGDRIGGGDYISQNEGVLTRLNFSPSTLKNNTPVTESDDVGQPPVKMLPQRCKQKVKSKKKKKLLSDIDRALREGRQLRKTISRNREKSSESLEEGADPEEEQPSESEEHREVKMIQCSSREFEKTKNWDTESQMEDIQNRQVSGLEEIKPFQGDDAKIIDDSLPVSTSTSYKSPPSVIRSSGLHQFIDYLEGLSDTENPKFKRKKEKMLNELLKEDNSPNSNSQGKEPAISPPLEYYVKKLLDMSRECVANLSVSSENISTPNITDLDIRHEADFKSVSESDYSSKVTTKQDERIRKFRLKRAEELDDIIKSWKTILDKREEKTNQLEVAERDEPDYCSSGRTETFHEDTEIGRIETSKVEETEREINEPKDFLTQSPRAPNKYEEITQKCSERITELSNLLNKVRRDKEKILNSSSGTSTLTLSKDGRGHDENYLKREEEVLKDFFPVFEESEATARVKESPVLEGFVNRCRLVRPLDENISMTAIADSQSLPNDPSTCSESLPDVMDELLKREILTSPFKWSDEEFAMESITESPRKPSSIETVIGNFRKEMSKIRPFSLISPDNRPRYLVSTDEKYLEICDTSKRSLEREGTSFCGYEFFERENHANRYQEESSVESIDQALTSLGLNWAKSFLRKNEESRAMSSSSGSDEARSLEE